MGSFPLAQLILNGLALGSLYAMAALGLVVIYTATDVINFAQGELAMISAFVAFALRSGLGLPYWAAVALTLAFAFAAGAGLARVAIRPGRHASPLSPVIVTVGAGLVLYGIAGWVWGYETRTFAAPVSGPPLRLGGLILSRTHALILGAMLAVGAALFWFFRASRAGIALRAVSQDPLAARLMGVSVERFNGLGWGLGALLGAATGILIAPLTYLDPNMMGDVALKAFAAAVLGGLTSLPGAVIGGLLLGVIDSLVGYQAAELRTTVAFGIIVAVLAVRPRGLMGRAALKKV